MQKCIRIVYCKQNKAKQNDTNEVMIYIFISLFQYHSKVEWNSDGMTQKSRERSKYLLAHSQTMRATCIILQMHTHSHTCKEKYFANKRERKRKEKKRQIRTKKRNS